MSWCHVCIFRLHHDIISKTTVEIDSAVNYLHPQRETGAKEMERQRIKGRRKHLLIFLIRP